MNYKKILIVLIAATVLTATASAAVLSVSEIKFSGNSEFFDGEMFAIDFVSDGSTDQIQTYVSPQQLSQEDENVKAEKGLTVKVLSQNFEARYATQDTDLRAIPKVVPKDRVFSTADERDEWAFNNCYNANNAGEPNGVTYSKWTISFDAKKYGVKCFVIDDSKGLWQPSNIQSPPRETFETKFTVQADGERQYTKTLSNSEVGQGKSAMLGEDIRVLWQGNLDTGVDAPNPGDTYAIHNNQEGGWRLVSTNQYSSYMNNYLDGGGVDRMMNEWHLGARTKDQIEREASDEYNRAISPYEESPLNGARVETTDNGGTYILDLDFQPSYPSFVIYADADYVGVKKTQGDPKIVSVDTPKVMEGKTDQTGQVVTTVKNDGDADGSFYTNLKCGGSDYFQPQGISSTKAVASGEVADFTNTVSFSSSEFNGETIEESCSVEVQDTTSLETDTQDISLKGQQLKDCRPNSHFTQTNENNDTVIYEWSEDCQQKEKVTTCDADKEYAELQSDSTYQCVEMNQPEEVGECDYVFAGQKIGEDPICNFNKATGGFAAGAGDIIRITVAFMVGLIGFGIGNRYLAEFTGIDNDQTKSIIGLALGIAFFLIVFALWSNPIAWILFITLLGAGLYLMVQLAPLISFLGGE